MTSIRDGQPNRRRLMSRTKAWARRWLSLAWERIAGEAGRPAERAESERGEHSGAGFSYKARDGF